jgi:hypothetical protein
MFLSKLTASDQETTRRCMVAVLRGPLLAQQEIHASTGLTPDELGAIIAQWPNIDDSEPDSPGNRAINNCLNVCNGILMSDEERAEWIGTSELEVERIFTTWRALQGLKMYSPD